MRSRRSGTAFARASAAVAVSGGLIAGMTTAGASPEASTREAIAAATTPLELKTVTPAKSLVAKPVHRSAPKVSRSQVRAALTQQARQQAAEHEQAAKAQARAEARAARAAAVRAQEANRIASAKQARAAQQQREARVAQERRTAEQARQARAARQAAAERNAVAERTAEAVRRASHRAPAVQAAPVARTTQAAAARSMRPVQTQRTQRTQQVAVRQAAAQPQQVNRTQVRHAVTQRSTQATARTTQTLTRSTQATARPAQATARTTQATTRTTQMRARSAAPSTAGVVGIASRYTGIRYVFGGSTPAMGLDCSGFVAYVFKQAGINLPHQSGAIRAMTTPVSNPQPGDLVFLPGHVAIYAGGGMVYEARNASSLSGLYPVLPGSTYGRLS